MNTQNGQSSWLSSMGAALLLLCSAWSMAVQAQELILINDSDGDRIVDTVDIDDDNDGILDALEIAPDGQDIDSDRDGLPNRLDLDSDNDGLLDWQESGALAHVDFSAFDTTSGRIMGPVGENGYLNALETSLDNGQPRYTLANTDFPADDFPDLIDLDSDNDGRPDLFEAGLNESLDSDRDGRIDIDIANGRAVGTDGIADRVQPSNDRICCDFNADGIVDVVPVNTDLSDLPDFQDLDSDNDGVSDLIELGGIDSNGDGRVDNFSDTIVRDGMDDSFLSVPLSGVDRNGNGVMDHLDVFTQENVAPAPVPEVVPNQPVDDAVTPPENMTNSDSDVEQTTETPTDIPAPDLDATGSGRDPAVRPGANIIPTNNQDFANDDPSVGLVETGLNASGCSIQSTGTDLLLLLLAVLSIAMLGLRYTSKRKS